MRRRKAMEKCLLSLFRNTTREKNLKTGPFPDPLRFGKNAFPRLPVSSAKSPESGLPHRIAKPHDPARKGFGRNVLEALSLGGTFARSAPITDHGRDAGEPVDRGIDEKAQFVDEARLQEGAVDDAAPFEEQRVRVEAPFDFGERRREGVVALPFEDVGNSAVAKFREVSVAHFGRQNGDQVFARGKGRVRIVELSLRVEDDRDRTAFAVSGVRVGNASVRTKRGGFLFDDAVGVFGHRRAAHHPARGVELRSGRFVNRRDVRAFGTWGPTARVEASVDRSDHVADDSGHVLSLGNRVITLCYYYRSPMGQLIPREVCPILPASADSPPALRLFLLSFSQMTHKGIPFLWDQPFGRVGNVQQCGTRFGRGRFTTPSTIRFRRPRAGFWRNK